MISKLCSALGVLFVMSCASVAQTITSPEAHLGRPLGADFELADWGEVSGYYRLLGAESPNVLVEQVGTTTEGRDFLLATISSADNLARLDQIKANAARIADPRGLSEEQRLALVLSATPILFISIAMHSTETAAPQFGMELAHRLATSNEEPFRSAREELVILIAPCLNPDGLDHVVSWYRENVGTPYEGAGLLKLYQYYAGHDNNRDWFMVSQEETRIVTRLLYQEWKPQVYWDVHQQGQSRERFFVPPFRDPLNPNLDPSVIAGLGSLGSRALFDMTREGLAGVSTGMTYDMWWNGGNRNVPVRHNIIGILTEAASVNIASPVFVPRSRLAAPGGLGAYAPSNRFPDPWPGGWWRLRDIIEYEHGFARSLLSSLSREPKLWLQNSLGAAERAIAADAGEGPQAWILPSSNRDRGAVERLVDALLIGGVEIERASAAFEADGRTWPADSLVIWRQQPYGRHVKDLFEVQNYPEGDPPYDVAGWTLPLLLGVRRVEVMAPFQVTSTPVRAAAGVADAFDVTRESAFLPAEDSQSWERVFADLAEAEALQFVAAGEHAGSFTKSVVNVEGEPQALNSLPRVGLYAPWSGSMDEGWTRFVFDRFGLPFVSVRNEMIRAGELNEFLDVLVIPSISARQLDRGRSDGSVPDEYAGGLAPEGATAIEDFVKAGGRLVTLGSSSAWAIELFDLPLKDVTRGPEAGEFSCPGSVLRVVPEKNVFTAGLPDSQAIFFSRSSAWAIEEKREEDKRELEVLMRYAPTRVLYSGWIRSAETIAGQGAWLRASHGAGSVHLFGFSPQYRGWSQVGFKLLFRSLLLGE